MTVHLISVGVGINDALRRRATFDSLPELAPAVVRAKPYTVLSRITGEHDADTADALLTRWFDGRDPAGPGTWPTAELTRLVDESQPQLWPTTISAELDTFHRATGQATLPDDDIAVLISTATVAGMTAALCNAVALTAASPDRIRYAGNPRALQRGVPPPSIRGTAVIVRIPHLDATTPADLRKAMRHLGTLGRVLLPPRSNPGEDFRFYLSGGFKAAIPFLIGLAEGMRSLPEISGNVQAYILHEQTRGKPIPLPLRRLRPNWVHRELAPFDDDGESRTEPDGDLLSGYAYDGVRPGPWQLTPFGLGLRELFGLQPADILRA